jgi:hypothetical protein
MPPKLQVGARLDATTQRTVGVDMPVALHERIEQLCDRVHDGGYARPSKRKMLAALVLASPTAATELDRLLRSYDGACVGDTLVTVKPKGNVVQFPKRRPGPRARGSR